MAIRSPARPAVWPFPSIVIPAVAAPTVGYCMGLSDTRKEKFCTAKEGQPKVNASEAASARRDLPFAMACQPSYNRERMSRGPDRRDLMRDKARVHVLTAMALGVCLLVASACQENVGPLQGRPTPEAPTQGSPVRHQYRYYPESAVYMDTGRRLFFYRDGERWLATTILPAAFRVDWKNYVVLEMDTDKPYLRHAEVVKKYPPKSSSRTLP